MLWIVATSLNPRFNLTKYKLVPKRFFSSLIRSSLPKLFPINNLGEPVNLVSFPNYQWVPIRLLTKNIL